MANLPFSCGKMRLVRFTTSNRVRGRTGGSMPLLFCFAQHPALVAANERLEAGEHFFAYLDDLYTSCEDPDRISQAHSALGEELERHAHISIHQVWNRGGLEVVWRGDATLPPEQQGIRVLGTLVGHPDFIRHLLRKKSDVHSRLFERIPSVGDLCPLLSLQRMPRSMTSKCGGA